MKIPEPIVRFDPNAPIDLSTFRIDDFVVRRNRVPDTNYIRYSTMVQDEVAGSQISYPTAADCQQHVNHFHSRTKQTRQRAAMLDIDLHAKIIGILGTKEMDNRDLCRMFSKTSVVMGPVLDMLVAEERIKRRGTARRPIFTAPPAPTQTI